MNPDVTVEAVHGEASLEVLDSIGCYVRDQDLSWNSQGGRISSFTLIILVRFEGAVLGR